MSVKNWQPTPTIVVEDVDQIQVRLGCQSPPSTRSHDFSIRNNISSSSPSSLSTCATITPEVDAYVTPLSEETLRNMDEDSAWEFYTPRHYCDLPSAVIDDDSEQAAIAEDTIFYDCDYSPPKAVEQNPVIRRRSRSAGSRPEFLPKTQVVKEFIGGLRTYNPPVQTHEALKVTKPFGPVNVSKKTSIQQGVPNPSMARQGEVLRMVQRVKMRPSHSEENDYKFHAKPAPKFKHPLVDRKQAIPVTVPHTPKFSEAGKASLQSWRRKRSRSNLTLKQVMEEERKKREFHANPCPDLSNPAIPVRPTLRISQRARARETNE